jgi:hypothetical protein
MHKPWYISCMAFRYLGLMKQAAIAIWRHVASGVHGRCGNTRVVNIMRADGWGYVLWLLCFPALGCCSSMCAFDCGLASGLHDMVGGHMRNCPAGLKLPVVLGGGGNQPLLRPVQIRAVATGLSIICFVPHLVRRRVCRGMLCHTSLESGCRAWHISVCTCMGCASFCSHQLLLQ